MGDRRLRCDGMARKSHLKGQAQPPASSQSSKPLLQEEGRACVGDDGLCVVTQAVRQ